MYVGPSDGHALHPHQAPGPICPRHGVPLFSQCPTCHAGWPLLAKRNYAGRPDSGADFCAKCATPAPWLSRAQILAWIENQVRALGMSGAIPRSTALELAEMVERLGPMAADDTRAVEAWRRLRDTVPKVWEMIKPVATTVIGEAVKKALGL